MRPFSPLNKLPLPTALIQKTPNSYIDNTAFCFNCNNHGRIHWYDSGGSGNEDANTTGGQGRDGRYAIAPTTTEKSASQTEKKQRQEIFAGIQQQENDHANADGVQSLPV